MTFEIGYRVEIKLFTHYGTEIYGGGKEAIIYACAIIGDVERYNLFVFTTVWTGQNQVVCGERVIGFRKYHFDVICRNTEKGIKILNSYGFQI